MVPEGTKSGRRGYSSSFFPRRDLTDKLPGEDGEECEGFGRDANPHGGTVRTVTAAEKFKKVYLKIDLSHEGDPEAVRAWLKANQIKTLNVAGPRESEAPGIHDCAVEVLRRLSQ
jgi:hypothetical protein